jgi:DNA-binding GntR family transcriptional regulator
VNAARKLERPKSLTDMAIESIRVSIVEGRLALGGQLSEAALALELGISKTPVREALLQLRGDGLVDIHPQRGTYVFKVDHDDVVQICRFREILESAALAEAMTNDREGLVAELEVNLRKPRTKRSLPGLDAEFHSIIMRRSNNDYLRSAYRLIEHKIHALRWRLPAHNEQIADCQDNHALLVERMREGKVAQAQTLLKHHIRDTREAYLQAGARGAA